MTMMKLLCSTSIDDFSDLARWIKSESFVYSTNWKCVKISLAVVVLDLQATELRLASLERSNMLCSKQAQQNSEQSPASITRRLFTKANRNRVANVIG